jgi:hypothetical protein
MKTSSQQTLFIWDFKKACDYLPQLRAGFEVLKQPQLRRKGLDVLWQP